MPLNRGSLHRHSPAQISQAWPAWSSLEYEMKPHQMENKSTESPESHCQSEQYKVKPWQHPVCIPTRVACRRVNNFASFAGVWVKDTSRSDQAAYGRALDLMQLNGLQKTTALRLIEGVEIQQDASNFSVNFLTVVPFFKVRHTHLVCIVNDDVCLAGGDISLGMQSF